MKISVLLIAVVTLSQSLWASDLSDYDQYPSIVLSNSTVRMQVFLPDPENGLYRATRFDWSGMIGSVRYKDHEYFGFWRKPQDPMSPVGVVGPADTYKTPGLGYGDAKPGEGFIRIGVGIVRKEDEPEYDYHNDYAILDHGEWSMENGDDWIKFTHVVNSDFGFGYVYTKTVRLDGDGFSMHHDLHNTGTKRIETDQYNHNFIMLDFEKANPSFEVTYPYPVSTESDTIGLMEVRKHSLHFTKVIEKDTAFMALKGFAKSAEDNTVTVENTSSGVGITVNVDKPLDRLEFWTNGLVLCPENTIQLRVEPGETETWTSDFRLFAR